MRNTLDGLRHRLIKPASGTLLAVFVALAASAAEGRELRIGLAAEPTSVDPHFHNLNPNNALRRHIFDALIDTDPQMKLKPALAVSWTAKDATTWEIKLRPGVKFSNGDPFTANDVIYTFCRVPLVENSPSSFATFLQRQ